MTKPTGSAASAADEGYIRFVLTDAAASVEIPEWSITSEALGLDAPVPFKVWKKTLHGGKQEGSTLIGIEAGELSVLVVPTRGMGLYKAYWRGVEFGWQSPVDEIVHPSFVDMTGRGGLGWLDGFNELMVRCGYEWTGHPYRDGERLFTLHGRAANTPASVVAVEIERRAPYRIRLCGLLKEKTFACVNFEIATELTVNPGEGALHIHDRLTNKSDAAMPYQIIYHTNFGRPLLGEGARIAAPVKGIVPLNQPAGKNAGTWQTYAGPISGLDEDLFGLELGGDANRRTLVALIGADGGKGAVVRYRLDQLPFFTLWKNTHSYEQGYVTGLEPASNYPHPRKLEEEHGRLQKIAGGATQDFELAIQFLADKAAVTGIEAEIDELTSAR